MVASIFKDLISKYFPAVAAKLTERFNGKVETPVFEHQKYLKPEFSTDMKFSSLSSNSSIVAADVVSLDSELPLKKRGSFQTAEGEIPKLGMKKSLNETQLQGIKNLKSRGGKHLVMAQKLFTDLADGVKGVYERLDIMFLQALSTGVTIIDENNNTGTGIRVDFGIPSKNQFGVQKEWTDASAKPITDIENVVSAARGNGNTLLNIFMDKVTFNAFKSNEEVKKAFAGFNRVDASLIFRINRTEIDAFLLEEFGMTLIVIDKTVQVEKGGVKVGYEPWERGNVTFTSSLDLGTITWSELAELDSPVDGVEYGVIDSFILGSLYRTNDPLRENTSVQALAIPVLDNVDSIYIMDTNEATASLDTQTEDDADYSYNSVDYTKVSVVAGINAARSVDNHVPKATTAQSDATLAKKIDSLSDAGIALFEDELVASA
jgi:hypothetical protein